MSRALVVDDKEMMRDSVSTTLARKGHTVVTAGGAKAALAKLTERPYDVVVTDLQMPEMDGLEFVEELRKLDEQLPVILMTAYGTVETAVKAMKLGAFDFLTKPFSGDELMATVERALEHSRLVKENSILKAAGSVSGARKSEVTHELIGSSEAMRQLTDRLEKIANSHGTVLITGESGAGKEVAARWIHEHSPRAKMPFLAINCAALSTNLLESELFGHEKGAFTGADKLRKGRFELADGGTLLLDEISEISPELQAKLLRVLQERTFERVGSSSARGVDVRVIATTNRDLPAEVAKGTFRQDLYFRLNVLPVHMPALREHKEDLTELTGHFLKDVAKREGRTVKRLDEAAMTAMKGYEWPGNVRELQNICERAAVLTNDEIIRGVLIEPWLNASVTVSPMDEGGGIRMPIASMVEVKRVNGVADSGAASLLPEIICDGQLTLDQVEREVIVKTLEANQGHRQKSARALGIGVRTLGLKLKKWKEEQLVAQSL
ncbi:MAG TPA: sigma-54 dependent transcriptional regulator [Phycisphaerales bacterium]|nr:sigma-54 dependent transcriptional regulator [Phycisphaerales bacterium]